MVVGTKPGLALAAVGSATVAVLSQSSGIERPFFAMRRGHVVYNNCALYMFRGGCRIFGMGGLLNAKGWYSMVAVRPPSLRKSGGMPPWKF